MQELFYNVLNILKNILLWITMQIFTSTTSHYITFDCTARRMGETSSPVCCMTVTLGPEPVCPNMYSLLNAMKIYRAGLLWVRGYKKESLRWNKNRNSFFTTLGAHTELDPINSQSIWNGSFLAASLVIYFHMSPSPFGWFVLSWFGRWTELQTGVWCKVESLMVLFISLTSSGN